MLAVHARSTEWELPVRVVDVGELVASLVIVRLPVTPAGAVGV